MNMVFKLAWRNLWRNRRRTQLTMGAMIFACTMLVFALGYYDGILWNLINNATEKENGHICVAREGWYEKPSLVETIDQSSISELSEKFADEIKGICPRISAFALLSCGNDASSRTQPAQLIGVDAQAELKSSRVARDVVKGSFLTGKAGEVVIGQTLARRLKAEVGSEIVLFSHAADGSMASELLEVTGIFDSGDSLRDSALGFLNIDQAQEIFVLEGRVHSFRMFLKDPMAAIAISSRIKEMKVHEATPWQVMFPQVADLLNIWVNVQIFTTIIFYAALALITFNTMYMAFLERMHEFAVMKAIGLERKRLAAVILLESLMISGLSGIIGVALGSTANIVLFYHPIDLSGFMQNIAWGGTTMEPKLFCVPSLLSALMPFVAMLLLGAAVSVLPNWRLYRLNPVEALRES